MKKAILLTLFIAGKISMAQSFELNGNDTVNFVDQGGLKQGFWIILNKIKKLPGYKEEQKVEEGSFRDSKKFGMWKQFFPSGNMKNEITYANNRPTGYAKMYYENGNIMEEGNWDNGRWTGAYKQYYENGKVFYEWGYNAMGKREGNQKYFHENGNVMIEGNWQEGKENGVIKEFYANGKLKSEKAFNGGTIDLEASKEYSEEGNAVLPHHSNKAPEAKKAEPDKKEETKVAVTDTKTTESVKEETKVISTSPAGVDILSDGFHKIFNSKHLVTKEGTFKDGKLMEGNQYEYEGTVVVKTYKYVNGRISETIDNKKK